MLHIELNMKAVECEIMPLKYYFFCATKGVVENPHHTYTHMQMWHYNQVNLIMYYNMPITQAKQSLAFNVC